MTKWAVVSAFQIEPHWSSGWHGLSVTFKAIFHMTVFSSHLSYRLVLNVQHVGFRMIYWKKLNMIFIMMFSLVYNHLKLRIIIFWMNVLFLITFSTNIETINECPWLVYHINSWLNPSRNVLVFSAQRRTVDSSSMFSSTLKSSYSVTPSYWRTEFIYSLCGLYTRWCS